MSPLFVSDFIRFRRIDISNIVLQLSKHQIKTIERHCLSSTGTTWNVALWVILTKWLPPWDSMANTYFGHNFWSVHPIFMLFSLLACETRALYALTKEIGQFSLNFLPVFHIRHSNQGSVSWRRDWGDPLRNGLSSCSLCGEWPSKYLAVRRPGRSPGYRLSPGWSG